MIVRNVRSFASASFAWIRSRRCGAVRWDADGADVLARCALEGSRTLVGRDAPEVTVHFTGTVRLTAEAPADRPEREVPAPDGLTVRAGEIYKAYFHGPAYQVLAEAWRHHGDVAGRFARELPANHER